MPAPPRTAALIVAAGRGSRAGDGPPKQYRDLAGHSVLRRSIAIFAEHPEIAQVQAVIGADDSALYRGAVPATMPKLLPPAVGGATRQESVLLGLRALAPHQPEIVLVHDAARPFATAGLVGECIAQANQYGAAAPGAPPADTLVWVDARGFFLAGIDRAGALAVQTPQGFRFADLIAAHERAAREGAAFTDDAGLFASTGAPVRYFAGDPANGKLTIAADFQAARARLAPEPLVTRVATGFDVHAFGPGDHVWLGGLRIAHDRRLVGHSDADVALHALTDALLGAIADGDIGQHFPPSDPRWRGASSDIFLRDAVARVAARGGVIDHLDLVIVCEAPKIGPQRDRMRARIAEIAGLAPEQVAVKATTSEKLGFTGRREGIVAQATASVRLPPGVRRPA